MLARWLRRRRWRRSFNFITQVDFAYRDVVDLHGAAAIEAACRKVRRRKQPLRRKWVWQAVVARLKVEASQA